MSKYLSEIIKFITTPEERKEYFEQLFYEVVDKYPLKLEDYVALDQRVGDISFLVHENTFSFMNSEKNVTDENFLDLI